MNKHAFLIGVYKNPDYLEELISTLDSDRSVFYVHINKINIKEFSDLIKKYERKTNVKFLAKVRYKWGGVRGVTFIHALLKEAIQDKEISFFHFISGQEVLIKPLSEFFDFFDNNKDNNFIGYDIWENNPWRKNGGLEIERYSLYNFYDVIDIREYPRFMKYVYRCRDIQRILGIKRKAWPFEKYYFGDCWWSLNREGVSVIYNFLQDKNNWKYINYTFAPDEALYQDILLNSEIKDTVVNNNLRYIDWSVIDGGSPKTLTMEDYDKLVSSDRFFARKIDPVKSRELIEALREYIRG